MNTEPITKQVDRNLIPEHVCAIMAILIEKGFKCFIAGGAVRDILIGRECDDWDLATDALPDMVEELFDEAYITYPIGKKYGTIIVVGDITKPGIEITTFRLDGKAGDGRRPDSVEFSIDPCEDVMRRDFTMNGLLMNNLGVIYDWVGGIKDIENKTVRAIGNPEVRFGQDKLRLMRMVRQATCLDFEVEMNTYNAAYHLADLVLDCDGSAICKELEKILISDYSRFGFELLHSSRILRYILPEVEKMYGFNQNSPWHSRNLWDHTMTVVESVPNTVPLRLAALLHDTGKMTSRVMGDDGVAHYPKHHLDSEDNARDICERLRLSNKDSSKVCKLVREHMSREWNMPDSGVKRFITRVGIENLDELSDLQVADIVSSRPPFDLNSHFTFYNKAFAIIEADEPMKVTDLAVNGHDIMACGFTGKRIGIIQEVLLEVVLTAPDLNTHDYLMSCVRGKDMLIAITDKQANI